MYPIEERRKGEGKELVRTARGWDELDGWMDGWLTILPDLT